MINFNNFSCGYVCCEGSFEINNDVLKWFVEE